MKSCHLSLSPSPPPLFPGTPWSSAQPCLFPDRGFWDQKSPLLSVLTVMDCGSALLVCELGAGLGRGSRSGVPGKAPAFLASGRPRSPASTRPPLGQRPGLYFEEAGCSPCHCAFFFSFSPRLSWARVMCIFLLPFVWSGFAPRVNYKEDLIFGETESQLPQYRFV